MSFTQNVVKWAHERNLINGSNPQAQMMKLTEEMGELAASLARGNWDDATDAIGDCAVVLAIIAEQINANFDGCCNAAWLEIKDRKGRMVDGVFVKHD